MRAIGTILLLSALLAGCGDGKFKTYRGPEVTRIYVDKSDRRMYLLHGQTVLRAYDVALGSQPVGDKVMEGDGRTPEGHYLINRRNPRSEYHLSLGLSYPDVNDAAAAQALGVDPGGDIFIHGRAGADAGRPRDWTAGCIAISDDEIEDVYAMVRDGTIITIVP